MKEILEKIKETLETIDDRVYYGDVNPADLALKPWDFIVFERENAPISSDATSISYGIAVAVFREGAVPEGLEREIIDAMKGIPGIKLDTSMDIQFDYAQNPKSGDVVEMMVVHFKRGSKL